jgi:hypothetical protein
MIDVVVPVAIHQRSLDKAVAQVHVFTVVPIVIEMKT